MNRILAYLMVFSALPVVLLAQDQPVVMQKTLLQKLNMPTIYILLVCSMLIVWLTVDGYLKTGRKVLAPGADIEAMKQLFRAGDYRTAHARARGGAGPFHRIVAEALAAAPEGKAAVEDAAAVAVLGAQSVFNSRIAYLSVIGVIAPMIGLTGTVFGMIEAFAAMGQAGAADPSKLSAAIGAVLYATAGGLLVAIPAFVFYYLLRNRVAHAFHDLHVAASELFRQFPYEHLRGVSFEGAEPVAALPNWLAAQTPVAAEGV